MVHHAAVIGREDVAEFLMRLMDAGAVPRPENDLHGDHHAQEHLRRSEGEDDNRCTDRDVFQTSHAGLLELKVHKQNVTASGDPDARKQEYECAEPPPWPQPQQDELTARAFLPDVKRHEQCQ